MVIGEGNDRASTFRTLDSLHAQRAFTKLIYLDTWPTMPRDSDRWAMEWAKERRVATKGVIVLWKFGQNAPVIRFAKLVGKRSRTKPTVIVAFTNKEITPQVKKAQKAGVEVVFA
jgi:hypothetical protein